MTQQFEPNKDNRSIKIEPFRPSHSHNNNEEILETPPIQNEDLDGADENRKQQSLRLSKKRIFYVLGVIIFLWAIFTLPIPIGRIQIEGTKGLTEKDVIAIGNLNTPVNILSVSRGKLEEQLQHDLRVESAKVTYQLPLTLHVGIEERKVVVVAQTQFGYVGIDKQGQIIQTGPAIQDTKATILSGIKLGNVLLGDLITNESILGAIKYLLALSPEGRKNIVEINVSDETGLVAYTVSGLPIQIGDIKQLDEKAKLTEDMLQDLEKKHVQAEYINVNVKSPYYKVR